MQDVMLPLLEWLKKQGVEFRLPELLLAIVLVPLLLLFYVGARRSRRHVARAFRVASYRPRRTWRGAVRGVAVGMLWLGLAGTIAGFARPVLQLPTPDDRATVIVVMDASIAMRATDVSPARIEAAKAVARTMVKALPERLQVGLVGYSASAYILQAPTHDHGAVPAALARLRTGDGAALGDGLIAALAAIPVQREEGGATASGAPAGGVQGGGQQGPPPKVPSAVVLISTGDVTGGRDLGDAVSLARDAGVPIHVVGVGPRAGTELKAPFDDRTLRQLAQATGGRYYSAPSANDWRQAFREMGSAVTVETKPQEMGQFVGAGGLAVMALSMLIMLASTRRLV
jgi:Ca-activated chloride channel homolog